MLGHHSSSAPRIRLEKEMPDTIWFLLILAEFQVDEMFSGFMLRPMSHLLIERVETTVNHFNLLFMATDIYFVDGHYSRYYAVVRFLIRNFSPFLASSLAVVFQHSSRYDEFSAEQEGKASILSKVYRKFKSLSMESFQRQLSHRQPRVQSANANQLHLESRR